MTVTIYHNPACGTSRNTLALIRATGVEPTVIEYLKAPPSRERLAELLLAGGMKPRDALREKGPLFEELGLGERSLTDEQILDAIAAHPALINRPLVETPKGVRLCRQSERVLEILEAPLPADFVKEDGEVVPAVGPTERA